MNRFSLATAAIVVLVLAGCEGGGQESAGNESGNQAVLANEALPTGGAVKPPGAAAIQVGTKEPYGQYLVDAAGRAIYVLEGSRQAGGQAQQGQQAQQAQPSAGGARTCTGECLAEWPPVLTQGAPSGGQGVDAGKLGTTSSEAGQQVTYAGWPLYYYRGDRDPGSTSGQEVHDRWGGWYLLSPQGERIEGREMGPSAE